MCVCVSRYVCACMRVCVWACDPHLLTFSGSFQQQCQCPCVMLSILLARAGEWERERKRETGKSTGKGRGTVRGVGRERIMYIIIFLCFAFLFIYLIYACPPFFAPFIYFICLCAVLALILWLLFHSLFSLFCLNQALPPLLSLSLCFGFSGFFGWSLLFIS